MTAYEQEALRLRAERALARSGASLREALAAAGLELVRIREDGHARRVWDLERDGVEVASGWDSRDMLDWIRGRRLLQAERLGR